MIRIFFMGSNHRDHVPSSNRLVSAGSTWLVWFLLAPFSHQANSFKAMMAAFFIFHTRLPLVLCEYISYCEAKTKLTLEAVAPGFSGICVVEPF